MHLETASMVVFSMKNAITIKVGTCVIETELANTGGSDERMAWQIFSVGHQSTAAIIGRKSHIEREWLKGYIAWKSAI